MSTRSDRSQPPERAPPLTIWVVKNGVWKFARPIQYSRFCGLKAALLLHSHALAVFGLVAVAGPSGSTGWVKTPKRCFCRMKKGAAEPSPLGKPRPVASVEVGFSGPSAVGEFSHRLFSRGLEFGPIAPMNVGPLNLGKGRRSAARATPVSGWPLVANACRAPLPASASCRRHAWSLDIFVRSLPRSGPRVPVVPEARKRLAGGAAQRNHRTHRPNPPVRPGGARAP